MTDLEITRLCAEAMGVEFKQEKVLDPVLVGKGKGHTEWRERIRSDYDPLHNDAQAFALIKKFGIEIHCRFDRNGWYIGRTDSKDMVVRADFNRAICECVANMRSSKETA